MVRRKVLYSRIAAFCLILCVFVADRSLGQALELDEALSLLGFDPKDSERLLDGKILSGHIKEGGDKELAVTVAMWVPGKMEDVISLVRDLDVLYASRSVLGAIDIGLASSTENAFAQVGYTPDVKKELSALAKVKPGKDFNLSETEIEQIQKAAAGGGDRTSALVHAYRELLLNRYEAYRESGVSGIAPYARSRGKQATPASELKTAVAKESIYKEYTPEFYRAFANYPQDAPTDVENQFLCIRQIIQDRPTLIPSHLMFQLKPDYAVFAERQFFVGQS